MKTITTIHQQQLFYILKCFLQLNRKKGYKFTFITNIVHKSLGKHLYYESLKNCETNKNNKNKFNKYLYILMYNIHMYMEDF